MKSATCFFNCWVVALGLALCVSTFRAHSQTGEKHKPGAKLWKSEKEQGETAFKNRQADEAETHFKAALAEAENFDAKDYRLAESLTELGDFYTRVNRFAEAEPLLQRAATIRRGDPSPLVEANVNFLLGYACIQLRHYDDAEKALLRARELFSRKSGSDSPPAAQCMYYLGVVYDDKGDYTKAEPMLKRSASLFEHPATRLKMHNNNDPAANAGSDVWISKYRPDYIYAIEAQARLGAVYSTQDQKAQAETCFKTAIKLLDERLAKSDPLASGALSQITAVLLARTNYAGAEPFLQRAVALAEKTQGPDQPATLNAKSSLAAAYMYEGKYDEAETTYKQLIAMLEKSGGDNKNPLIQTLNNYALMLRIANRAKEAAVVEARAKKIQAGADK
jgi:tetratricopeptide (TPR) repeat protein